MPPPSHPTARRDVEHHNVHSYAGMTCLLQLSTGTHQGLWVPPQGMQQAVSRTPPLLSQHDAGPQRLSSRLFAAGTDGPAASCAAGAKDFLVDCLALKAEMQLLDPVLSNSRIMKVGWLAG